MNHAVLDRSPSTDACVSDNDTGARQTALLRLLEYLSSISYRFVTTSPASHQRVVARHGSNPGQSREDVLGWSRPFIPGSIDPTVEGLLVAANAIEDDTAGLRRSRLRVSTVHQRLFLHSAFPTRAEDSVFLGPDSYRFADFIARELAHTPLQSGEAVVDIGTGSGVGAVVAADMAPEAQLFMTDINSRALALARINAQAANLRIVAVEGRNLAGIEQPLDLITANPPYVIDPVHRAYRDGGQNHGSEISLEMTHAALPRLKPGGRFLLYTGSAIVGGADLLKAALVEAAETSGCAMRYAELDPDVFGEELEATQYFDVDRIAAVAAVMTKPVE
ncbi:class I SAM-dependent methyltransferase [Sphingobium yanoikuyae]|uniref:class I SAM-dependent methyltransferase n=1 Tax=Sphingobium yanoikuyae TaxID=13690 RepID=UPI0022DDAE4E|nr:class I SAM-dependent methyltransferase [Sphingobium yanoikuyae]WBQ19145.1 class I SAM-dependent methyltransferase [Sphingobium yanoikuyae]